MSFNLSKYTVIRVAPNKSKTVIHTNYQLHGHTLEIVDSSKYLGVTLTSNLSWDKHVDNVAAKGNRTLGFIRRNLKDCTRTVKETSYIAIVRPTIEYAATVWDPTSQSKIKALENIQRRAARFVTNNYTDRTPGCVTNMITSLGWQSLEQRRQNSRLCMLCKIYICVCLTRVAPTELETVGNDSCSILLTTFNFRNKDLYLNFKIT